MRYTIAIVWVVVIAILHAIPGSDIPEFYFSDFFQLDKLIHAVIFMIGVYLSAVALKEQQKIQFNAIHSNMVKIVPCSNFEIEFQCQLSFSLQSVTIAC